MKKKYDRAEPFIATRAHHDFEIAEDYVEIISDLLAVNDKARVCDIATQMGVSHVTVIRTLKRLEKKGLLNSEESSSITLTKEGEALASSIRKRHLFLFKYLTTLGVPEEIARIDVEGMEHHVSETTQKVLQAHLEKYLEKS